MRDEVLGLGIKAVATAISAVAMFELTWGAIAAAIVGAAASYHFEAEQKPAKLPRLFFDIFATGFAAAFAAVAAPHVPLLAWSADIPLGIRAGLLGLLVRPMYHFGKRWAENRTAARPGG